MRRLPFLALGMVAVLAGMWAGLVRLGWGLPALGSNLPAEHGPLMVLGFLGTLIGLERAVALGRRWAFACPAATGLGALALVAGLPPVAGYAAMLAGGGVLAAVFLTALRLQPSAHTRVMALGAVCWLVAAALLVIGWDVSLLVPWLAGFLVLTIVGERLELSRMVHLTRAARRALLGAIGVFSAGLAISLVGPAAGVRAAGVGLVLQAAWLLRFDAARRTVRTPGLPRYVALCLLPGYAWLAAGGALWAGFGTLADGPAYDAMLHAVFLGFVMSMVFGHAPIIVPAVFGRHVRTSRSSYVPVVLLHASLLLRLVGGDLLGDLALRRWGGLANVVAVLAFLAATAVAVAAGRDRPLRAVPVRPAVTPSRASSE